jgi:hypothetical protein
MSSIAEIDLASRVAILGSGALTGVMLAIGIGLGGYWLTLPPQEFDAWLTHHFVMFLPAVILVLTPALISVWICRSRCAPGSPSRRHWNRSLAGLLVMVVTTTIWHLPLNMWVWFGDPIPDATLEIVLYAWLIGHVLRVAGPLVATLQAVDGHVGQKP